MKCVFLDYDNIINGYRLWGPIGHKAIVGWDVIFNENSMQRKEVPDIVLIEVEMSEYENEAFDKHEEQQVQKPRFIRSTCPKRHLERYSHEF